MIQRSCFFVCLPADFVYILGSCLFTSLFPMVTWNKQHCRSVYLVDHASLEGYQACLLYTPENESWTVFCEYNQFEVENEALDQTDFEQLPPNRVCDF